MQVSSAPFSLPTAHIGGAFPKRPRESKSCLLLCIQKVMDFCVLIWHVITFGYFRSNKRERSLHDVGYEGFHRESSEAFSLIGAGRGFSEAEEIGVCLDQKLEPERPFMEFFKEVPSYQGAFRAKWLFSNELEQSQTLDWLQSKRAYGDTLIGTGCFFTLNAFSIRPEQVNHLVVIDISLGVLDFWNDIKAIALRSNSREEAIEEIIAKFEIDRSKCLEERTWLSSDAQFLKVKRLFQENKFAFVRANFTDVTSLQRVGDALKSASVTIDTIYESNIGSCSFAPTPVRYGGYGLSMIVQRSLVKAALRSEEEISFLEIYADGGSMNAVKQERYVRVFRNSE